MQRGEHLPALIAAPPVAAETFVDLLQVRWSQQTSSLTRYFVLMPQMSRQKHSGRQNLSLVVKE